MKSKSNIALHHIEEAMYIINAACWKCKTPQIISLVRGDYEKRGGTTTGPETFSPNEITIALAKGVCLKEQYSNSMDETYLANSCYTCGNFVGQFFLFKDYLNPAEMGKYTFERIAL